MAKLSVDLLKMGVTLHCMVAIWLYGHQYIEDEYLAKHSITGSFFNLASDWGVRYFAAIIIFKNAMWILETFCFCFFKSKKAFRVQAGLKPYSECFGEGEVFEFYHVSSQEQYKLAFGPGLLPA